MISWENQPEPVDDDEGATREKLAARRYMAVRAVGEAAERRRVLREQEPEDRHMGTDQGRHHQNRLPTGPATGCGCGCQSVLEDESLLAIVGRQALDPVERYEQSRAEARAMLHGRTSRTLTGEQALRELDAMRVKFSVVEERHFGGDGAAHHRPDGGRSGFTPLAERCPSCQTHLMTTGRCPEFTCHLWGKFPGSPE